MAGSLRPPLNATSSVEEKEEKNVQFTEDVVELRKTMRSAKYREKMGSLQETDYFNDLKTIFTINSTPPGLMVSLSGLTYNPPTEAVESKSQTQPYAFHFKIDDSGSMESESPLTRNDASAYMKTDDYVPIDILTLTRWQEVENRLHVMIDLLAFIPTGKITFSFLNSSDVRQLDRAGKNHIQFSREAHCLVRELFQKNRPAGGTPILEKMEEMFTASEPTMNYLLTDGSPNGGDREKEQIKQLLLTRANPERHPFTFLGCSNERIDHIWMFQILIAVPDRFFAAVANFQFQKEEVVKNHGSYHYPLGFWLLSNLVAAKDPNIGALTQPIPFTRAMYEHLSGTVCSEAEYKSYFQSQPLAVRLFQSDYLAFFTSKKASEIEGVKAFKVILATGCNLLTAEDKYKSRPRQSKKNVFNEKLTATNRNASTLPADDVPSPWVLKFRTP